MNGQVRIGTDLIELALIFLNVEEHELCLTIAHNKPEFLIENYILNKAHVFLFIFLFGQIDRAKTLFRAL